MSYVCLYTCLYTCLCTCPYTCLHTRLFACLCTCLYKAAVQVWPGNATARCKLAGLELEHGCFQRASLLYETIAMLPPCAALPASATASSDWYRKLVEAPRSEAVAIASYKAAVLLHLAGRFDAAVPHLRRLGMGYRLSPAVWTAVAAGRQPEPQSLHVNNSPAFADVARYSGAVPAPLLRQLKKAFAPRSPYWEETSYFYTERGYFSFWFDVSQPPTNAVERLAMLLLPLTGCAERIVGCDWWVHSKQESRFIGHQMHYDTEEGVLKAEGQVVHPAVSSVIYLSGESIADPTVILDQRLSDDVPAAHAHVSHPAEGHVLFFPGDRLHCVCPAAPDALRQQPRGRRGRPAPLKSGSSESRRPRRVTLMIGFWAQDVASAIPRAPLTACGPMPRVSRACTWPTLLVNQCNVDEVEPLAQVTRHAVPVVTPAWEALKSSVDSAAASADSWADQPLELSEAYNNRFFVHEMEDDEFFFVESARGKGKAAGGTANDLKACHPSLAEGASSP